MQKDLFDTSNYIKKENNNTAESIDKYQLKRLLNNNSKSMSYIISGIQKCEKEDHENALIDFSKAIEINSEIERENSINQSPEILFTPYLNRGICKAKLRRHKEAIVDYNSAINLIADFDIDSRIEWEAYLIYENRAISKLILDENGASNDLKKAEEFRQLKAFNKSVGLLPKSSEDYYKLALRKISFNPTRLDIKTSLLHLNKAIQIDPQNVKAFVARANLNRDIDNFQDAFNDYSSAISIDPEYLDVYKERAKSYRIIRNFQGAIEDFEKVLEIDPNHHISILNLASLYEDKEKFVKAIELYERLIKIESDSHNYQSVARCYEHLNKYEEAIENYDKAIETCSKEEYQYFESKIEYLEDKSQLLIHLKKYDEAIIDLKKIIELLKESESEEKEQGNNYYPAKEIIVIGICHYLLGDYESSIYYLTEPIKSLKEYHIHQYCFCLRGQAFFKLGKIIEAKADWDKVAKIDEDYDIDEIKRSENFLRDLNYKKTSISKLCLEGFLGEYPFPKISIEFLSK